MQPEYHTDQILRERLQNASVPPPAFVWEGVERALQKKRRKTIFWWFFLAGLSLLSASYWYFNAPELPATTTLLNSQPPAALQSPQNEVNHAAPSVAPSSTIAATTPAQAPTSLAPINTKTHSSSAPKTSINTAFSAKNGLNNTENSEKAMSINPEVPPMVAPVPAAAGATAATSNAVPNAAQSTPARAVNALPLLPLNAVSLLQKRALPTPMPLAKRHITTKKQGCFDFNDRPNAWLIHLYGGPLTAQKTLGSGSSLELEVYRQQRLETEGRGWGFTAGTGITHIFNRHYSISSGVQYQQFTETFQYKDDLFIQYATENNNIDTLDAAFGVKTVTTYNRFGFLDIPLLVGYEWRSGRKGVHIKGGGAMNVLFWKKGSMLHPDYFEPAAFNTNTGFDAFKTNIGWSVQGSAQFFWHIRRDTRVFAEPYYHSILRPVTTTAYPLAQRYNMIGLRLGMSKLF